MKLVTLEVVVRASILVDESELPQGKRSDSLVAKRAVMWLDEQITERIEDAAATIIRSKVVSVEGAK